MRFDVVQSSQYLLPKEAKYNSLYEMIFDTQSNEDTAIIVGENAVHDNPIILRDIQNAVCRVYNWCQEQQIRAGDTVAILHFANTSEIPLALSLLAFLACGVRVYLPQHNHHVDFTTTATTAIIAVLHEYAPQQQHLKNLYNIPIYCAHHDLKIFAPTTSVAITRIDDDEEAIVFTTSGSTEQPKLVCYTHGALINSCKAWETAGLFTLQANGGNSFCPTLSHTMGVRNLLGALWTRTHTLFIYREWLQTPSKIEKWLLKFPPQHITCGSALLIMLHKLKEQSSALRSTLNTHLHCIVASGCDIANNLEKLYPNARIANAFGTTETQQVMNTLLQKNTDSKSLGALLPGAQIAIRYIDKNNGQLFVNSPFSAKKYIGSEPFPEWIPTGDLVHYTQEKVYFVARENDMVVNSGLGIKLPLSVIESEYGKVLAQYPKIFYTHPKNIGVLALAFATEKNIDQLKSQAQSELEACYQRNNFLQTNAPLRAIGVVGEDIPISGIGKVQHSYIKNRFRDFLDIVADEEQSSPNKIYLQNENLHAYQAHIPYLGNLLHTLRLVRNYVRAQGNYLYTPNEKILDFVGGFSCNLLGYDHKIVRDCLQNTQQFFFDQGNISNHATAASQELRKIMAHITGKTYVACWASTGSEAVEIALKHAWFAQQNAWQNIAKKMQQVFVPPHIKDKCVQSYAQVKQAPVLIALRGSFHGRTLGSMQVLHKEHQHFSHLFAAKTIFIDEASDLSQINKQHTIELLFPKLDDNGEWTCASYITSRIFAIIVEPMQGEGGIREVSQKLLQDLQQFTAPLIVDEIQCGLGRCGSFFASSPIVADYYILGKALGASAAKISVTLIEKSHYIPHFDLQRTSTFYEDGFSCSIATKVLQVIQQDNIAQRCEVIGQLLRKKLQCIQDRYPHILCEIRGRGCMMGIKLQYAGNHFLLKQLLAEQIGYFAASYLLHNHALRILPTSSNPDVLRIQPSAYTNEAQLDHLANAVEQLCEILEQDAVTRLVGHLADLPLHSLETKPATVDNEVSVLNNQRVAFIHHPLSIVRELLAHFPQCARLTAQQKRQLSTALCELFQLRPLQTFRKNIHHDKLWLMGIALPAPPAFFKHSLLHNEIQLIEERLQQAIDLAVNNDCKTIILGAYTSIVAQKSDKIHLPQNVQVSAGNAYTLSLAWNDLNNSICKSKYLLQQSRIGIVGALGNIGRGYCKLLRNHDCEDLLLVGSCSSTTRLEKFRGELGCGKITTDLHALRDCDVIIVVSNHDAPLVFPQHIATNKQVLLQDLSQPANSDRSIRKCRNVTFLSPGLVRLPHDRSFRLSPSLPRGVCFACTAEGILLALSGYKLQPSWEINPTDVIQLLEEGKKYQLTTTVPSFF